MISPGFYYAKMPRVPHKRANLDTGAYGRPLQIWTETRGWHEAQAVKAPLACEVIACSRPGRGCYPLPTCCLNDQLLFGDHGPPPGGFESGFRWVLGFEEPADPLLDHVVKKL